MVEKRKTNETEIEIEIDLYGKGNSDINLEYKFFSHMLTAFTKYSGFDFKINATGDDPHHLIEDIGIVIGNAVKNLLGDKKGIRRFGYTYIPMDEALVRVCIDLCGRSYLHFDYDFKAYMTADFETQNVIEFLRAFVSNLGAVVHVDVIRGENDHHVIEAIFKALGAALKIAVEKDESIGIMSTKGVLQQ